MLTKTQILKRAIHELKSHSRELAALRKSKAKRLGRLVPDWPHTTYIIPGELQKKHIRRITKGVRVLLFENSRAVGTMDFSLHKSSLNLSHFTFGKTAHVFFRLLKKIYKVYRIPNHKFPLLLKGISVDMSFVQFIDGKVTKYFDQDSDSGIELDESSLIKRYNAKWKKMQAGERLFQRQKKQKKANAIAQLNFLKYL